jgi:hypothetical protein
VGLQQGGAMRSVIAAIGAGAAALVVVNMLGVASAEAPTGAPVRTVSVGGVATVPIAQGASAATATAVYRQGMAAAVSDGQGKAEFLAGKTATTLGGIQSVVEGGGYISCTDEESQYAQYQGEQPDFSSPAGSGGPVRLQGAAAPTSAPTARRPSKRRHRRTAPAAKKAAGPACSLTAQVTLVYAIT